MMKQLPNARLANVLEVPLPAARKLGQSRKQQSQAQNPHGEASSGHHHDQHPHKRDGTRLLWAERLQFANQVRIKTVHISTRRDQLLRSSWESRWDMSTCSLICAVCGLLLRQRELIWSTRNPCLTIVENWSVTQGAY